MQEMASKEEDPCAKQSIGSVRCGPYLEKCPCSDLEHFVLFLRLLLIVLFILPFHTSHLLNQALYTTSHCLGDEHQAVLNGQFLRTVFLDCSLAHASHCIHAEGIFKIDQEDAGGTLSYCLFYVCI